MPSPSAWHLLEASAIARASQDPFAVLSVGAFPASREARYIFDTIARWPVLARESLLGILGIELELDLTTQRISEAFARDTFALCELAMLTSNVLAAA